MDGFNSALNYGELAIRAMAMPDIAWNGYFQDYTCFNDRDVTCKLRPVVKPLFMFVILDRHVTGVPHGISGTYFVPQGAAAYALATTTDNACT
jgi:hypothetical protein